MDRKQGSGQGSPPTFRQYVRERRVTDTPAGDFIADAKKDQSLPDVRSWQELVTYLIGQRNAHRDGLKAARTVWIAYERTRPDPALRNTSLEAFLASPPEGRNPSLDDEPDEDSGDWPRWAE